MRMIEAGERAAEQALPQIREWLGNRGGSVPPLRLRKRGGAKATAGAACMCVHGSRPRGRMLKGAFTDGRSGAAFAARRSHTRY